MGCTKKGHQPDLAHRLHAHSWPTPARSYRTQVVVCGDTGGCHKQHERSQSQREHLHEVQTQAKLSDGVRGVGTWLRGAVCGGSWDPGDFLSRGPGDGHTRAGSSVEVPPRYGRSLSGSAEILYTQWALASPLIQKKAQDVSIHFFNQNNL